MNHKKTALIVSVFLFLAVAGVVAVSSANPYIEAMIEVASPVNNQLYSSNSVQLTFSVLHGYNITSFSYSVDGQARKETNGSTMLTDLPSGTHSLAIYGNYTTSYTTGNQTRTYNHNNELLQIVHFNTNYPTNWIVFTIVFTAVVVPIVAVLALKRRQLSRRLKGSKNPLFWLGVASSLFAIVVSASSVWYYTSKYLFPPPLYPHGTVFYSLVDAVFGLIFLLIGVALMALGTRHSKTENNSNDAKIHKGN
jgi:hypothetical protein